MSATAVTLVALLAWLDGAAAGAAPGAATDDEVARLEGHEVVASDDGSGYLIADVAGEGAPLVGVVERTDDGALAVRDAAGRTTRLAGPLARPRIAGPGYKVWVLGDLEPGGALRARRLGVLAPPWKL